MYVFYTYVVKFKKENFAPASVHKNVWFFHGPSLKILSRPFSIAVGNESKRNV